MSTTVTTQHPDQFIAHRGLRVDFPENTSLAIQGALDVGARQIELDIQFSRDGKPVLYHDPKLLRVSDRKGWVKDFTLDELVATPAHEPGRFQQQFNHNTIDPLTAIIPFFDKYPDLHFYLELKDEAIAHAGMDYCLETIVGLLKSYIHRFTLIGFDIEAMTKAKEIFHYPRTGLVLRSLSHHEQDIQDSNANIVFINEKRLNPRKLPDLPCELAIYEIDNPKIAQKWLDLGIDKIESFCVNRLLDHFGFNDKEGQ